MGIKTLPATVKRYSLEKGVKVVFFALLSVQWVGVRLSEL